MLKTDLKLTNKIHAFFHLTNSANFLLLLIASIVSIPLLYIKHTHTEFRFFFNFGSVFLLGFLSISYFYWIANRQEESWKEYVKYFPLFVVFSMGFTLNNSLAVIEGLFGIKTPFERTPKFNIVGASGTWKGNAYLSHKFSWTIILEGLLSIYFLLGIILGVLLGDYGLLLFHLMLSIGYGSIVYYSVRN
jgi:hypothetical protein